jgi:hypothetical protein
VVVIQTDEMDNSFGKFLLESANVKTLVQSGVVNSGRVFGLVAVDFCDAKVSGDDLARVVDKVCSSAERIRYYLLFKDASVPVVAK